MATVALFVGAAISFYLMNSGPRGADGGFGGRTVLLVVLAAAGALYAGVGLLLTFSERSRPTGSLVLSTAGLFVVGMIIGFMMAMTS